jgi:hypothetical protein
MAKARLRDDWSPADVAEDLRLEVARLYRELEALPNPNVSWAARTVAYQVLESRIRQLSTRHWALQGLVISQLGPPEGRFPSSKGSIETAAKKVHV